jgi:hypothetical protein
LIEIDRAARVAEIGVAGRGVDAPALLSPCRRGRSCRRRRDPRRDR